MWKYVLKSSVKFITNELIFASGQTVIAGNGMSQILVGVSSKLTITGLLPHLLYTFWINIAQQHTDRTTTTSHQSHSSRDLPDSMLRKPWIVVSVQNSFNNARSPSRILLWAGWMDFRAKGWADLVWKWEELEPKTCLQSAWSLKTCIVLESMNASVMIHIFISFWFQIVEYLIRHENPCVVTS